MTTTTTAAPTTTTTVQLQNCVTGAGSGGCVMKSSGCGSTVKFSFHCYKGSDIFIYTLTMPDSYSWDMSSNCDSCFIDFGSTTRK